MARAYPVELRERAVAAVIAEGQPQAEVARLFDVALATLKRWLELWRAGQSLTPKVGQPGPAGQFDTRALTALRAQLAAAPAARLLDHCRRWRQTKGRQVSETTMWRALRGLGWTRKKSTS